MNEKRNDQNTLLPFKNGSKQKKTCRKKSVELKVKTAASLRFFYEMLKTPVNFPLSFFFCTLNVKSFAEDIFPFRMF